MKTDVGCRSSRDKYFPLNLANAYLYKRKIKNLRGAPPQKKQKKTKNT